MKLSTSIHSFFRYTIGYFSIISRWKYQLTLLILVFVSLQVKSQNNLVTLRDTLHFAGDSIQVVERQIDTSGSYTGNIFFHMTQQQSTGGGSNMRVIPSGCGIPIDNGCHGCDFENTSEVTTQYWGASVESFMLDNANNLYLYNDDNCPHANPIDPDNQCICDYGASNYGIPTPVYFCPTNTSSILNKNYVDCANTGNSASTILNTQHNHFRLTGYDEIYNLLGVGVTNNCSNIASHFGNNVLRIGDDYQFNRISTVVKRVIVTPQNRLTKFDFALVMEDPENHTEVQRPTFAVRLIDNRLQDVTHNSNNNSRVDLGWGENIIASYHPNLHPLYYPYYNYGDPRRLDNPKYLDWSCGLINLNDFNIGDTIYILFEVKDCSRSAHKGWAYIDNITTGFCSNITSEATVSYNSNASFSCGNNVHLCFDYNLPTANISGNTVNGNLQIYLQTYQNGQLITVYQSNIVSNAVTGQYCFDVPANIFSNYIQGGFKFYTTSQIGCFNLIPTNQNIIIPLPNGNPPVNLGRDTILCAGQSLVLNATNTGAAYLWSTNQTTPTITINASGTYWVRVTKNGCAMYDTIKVIVMSNAKITGIPFLTKHNCVDDASGILALIWKNKTGGSTTSGTATTYVNDLSYTIYKDDINNNTYDALCAYYYTSGILFTENKDSLFVNNLPIGDYKIVIKPINLCRKVKVNGVVTDSVCIPYSRCFNDTISFNFTVRKFMYGSPLGEDRILCPDAKVTLKILPGFPRNANSVVWGNAYCPPNPATVTIVNDSTRMISNGGGGYYTVQITTKDGCIVRDTVIVADLKPNTLNYQLPTALATSAVQQSSGWSSQFSNIQWEDADDMNDFANSNPYYNGSAGIFRPAKSSDYNDTLNTSTNLFKAYNYVAPSGQIGDASVRGTGNIINYKLFNYGNPLIADCVPQWVLNNTMTKYSPSGYDIENKDILNIHGSALYAYKDKMPVAVCSNAKVDEIGYEGFEEYSPNSSDDNYFNTKTQLNNSTGNIDIVRQTQAGFMPKNKDYEIVRAFNRYAMVKGNICSACENPFKCTVIAQSVPYDYTTEKITDKNAVSYETKVWASPCGDSSYTILQLDEGLPSKEPAFRCQFWAGKVSVGSKRYVSQLGTFNISLDGTISHTGKYSLKLPSNQRVLLPQVDLELQPKKTYYVGAWIHKASMLTESPESLKYTNASDSIGVLVILPNNEKIFLIPSGEVIDGWQRLEGTFTMPSGMRTEIQLGFVGKQPVNIDDIRIYPMNSAMQTYVYDPSNYKVRAVLDQNNYATMYSYDDEGNLLLLKKETVKGIKTIQVNNSHIKTTKP